MAFTRRVYCLTNRSLRVPMILLRIGPIRGISAMGAAFLPCLGVARGNRSGFLRDARVAPRVNDAAWRMDVDDE